MRDFVQLVYECASFQVENVLAQRGNFILKVHVDGRDAYYRRLGDLRYFLWLEEEGPEGEKGVKKSEEMVGNTNFDEFDAFKQKSRITNNWDTITDDFNNSVRSAVENASVLTLSDPYAYERFWSCISEFGRAREESRGRGDVRTGLFLQKLV